MAKRKNIKDSNSEINSVDDIVELFKEMFRNIGAEIIERHHDQEKSKKAKTKNNKRQI